MSFASDLTAEFIRSVLDYDPRTGLFFWRHRHDGRKQWNAAYAGKLAGAVNPLGYICFTLRRGSEAIHLKGHRVAWFLTHGEWPPADLDHINGKRDDNRIENLRLASRSENARNYTMYRNNRSGFPGVSFDTQSGRWQAKIILHRKRVWRKLFSTAEEAHVARQAVLPEFHGEFVHRYGERWLS